MPSKVSNPKDSSGNKLRRQHRIMGQKILNFLFNVSRRAVLMYESKMDAFKQREGADEQIKELSAAP